MSSNETFNQEIARQSRILVHKNLQLIQKKNLKQTTTETILKINANWTSVIGLNGETSLKLQVGVGIAAQASTKEAKIR